MFDGIENLKIISVRQKASSPQVRIANRKTHSFFFRVAGEVLYEFGDGQMTVREGELVFIPKGSSYEMRRLTEESRYMAVHFDADFAEEVRPTRFSIGGFREAEFAVSQLSDLYNFGTQAERYRCYALVFSLLSYLSAEENAQKNREALALIAPALSYLEKHLYDAALRVEKLSRLCGISGTYFRRIFADAFGVTPQEYILSKRLFHARSIIAGGDFDTVAEVAFSVGFTDPLYFSKAYKKAYGISPSRDGRNE